MNIDLATTPVQSILQHVGETLAALSYLVDELNEEQKQVTFSITNHLTGIVLEAQRIAHFGNIAPSVAFIADNSDNQQKDTNDEE